MYLINILWLIDFLETIMAIRTLENLEHIVYNYNTYKLLG
jgi:hypothetical protein